MKRPLRAAALLPVAGAVILAGCSASGTAANSAPSDTPSVAPSSASAAGAPFPSSPPAQSGPAQSGPAQSGPAQSGTTSNPAQKPVAPENNPPGDIPDNVAFVVYANGAGRYSLTHPEGWLQQVRGPGVLFTDKLNGLQVDPGAATSAPTVASARAASVPALTRGQAAFELRSVAPASVPGGTGVLVVYRRNSAPDQVTGRQYRDEVQRYELVANGHEVVVELFGPVGADNVDAYRTMITSLKLT